MKARIFSIPSVFSVIICIFIGYDCFRSTLSTLRPQDPAKLTAKERLELDGELNALYPERTSLLSQLPYEVNVPDLFINAESAILIDSATGSILFEKNADEPIPPASMTKLVEMYVVFEAIENGEVSLDDEVPLPPQSWAVNLPSDASIMFLAQGQHVTLRELLLGLSIASGNDASIAVANYICGNMEDFVQRMNSVIESLGLKNTHFVESSGYSEKNITTARDFVSFCRVYINRFPYAISDFHSQKILRYPLQKNLPDNQKSQGDSQAIVQYNTNKMLGTLDGCDGLKTGFIYESGYNIALTAKRGRTRFLSVTMKGPGKGSIQGNKYRNQDGNTLMSYAFDTFYDYTAENKNHTFTVGTLGSQLKSIKLIPCRDETFSVPHIKGDTARDSAESVKARAYIPEYVFGNIKKGSQYGTITYSIDDNVLQIIPLVADRDSSCTSGYAYLRDKYTSILLEILRNNN